MIEISIPGGDVQLSGNPILVIVTGAVKPAGASLFKTLLKVTSTDGVLRGGPFLDANVPDEFGSCDFDIQGWVDQPIDQDFEYPLVRSVFAYIQSAYNVGLIAGISYIDTNGDLQELWYPETNTLMQILPGKLTEQQLKQYYEIGSSFFQEWVVKGKFLSFQPDNLNVSLTQFIKLWMVSPYVANVWADLYVIAWYENDEAGTLSEQVVFPCELWRDGLFEFTLQPALNGLTPVKTGHRMLFYEAMIVYRDHQTVRDTRRYYIDWNTPENETLLLATNRLGGIDVWRLTGAIQQSAESTRTESYKPMRGDDTSKTRTRVTTGASGRKKYTINTGWLSLSEVEAFADVYLSQKQWLIIAGELIPANIEGGDITISDTMDDLHSLEVKLVEANNL